MSTKQLIKQGIELYTGFIVASLEIVPDPKVADSYAVRAKMEGEVVQDFVLHAGWNAPGREGKVTPTDVMNNLEECDFASWPPCSGASRR